MNAIATQSSGADQSIKAPRQWPLCVCVCVGGGGGDSPVIGEFPAQRASNAKDASIW